MLHFTAEGERRRCGRAAGRWAAAERLRTAAYLFSSFGFLNSMYFAVFPGSGAIQIRLYQSMMSSVGTGT